MSDQNMSDQNMSNQTDVAAPGSARRPVRPRRRNGRAEKVADKITDAYAGTVSDQKGNAIFEVQTGEDVKAETGMLTEAIARLINEAASGHHEAAQKFARRIARHNELKAKLKDVIRGAGADLQAVFSHVGIDMHGDFYVHAHKEFSADQVLELESRVGATGDSIPGNHNLITNNTQVA
jgi:hypothetical protein